MVKYHVEQDSLLGWGRFVILLRRSLGFRGSLGVSKAYISLVSAVQMRIMTYTLSFTASSFLLFSRIINLCVLLLILFIILVLVILCVLLRSLSVIFVAILLILAFILRFCLLLISLLGSRFVLRCPLLRLVLASTLVLVSADS